MWKSCSKCGKIHDTKYHCTVGILYRGGEERTLRSKYAWQRKSIEVRERANYLCEVCRDNGIYTYTDIEVHHIEKLREHKELFLEDENLICLCQYHHKLADDGKIDKDYLKELARKREGKQSPVGLV